MKPTSRTAILLVHGFYSDISASHYLARILRVRHTVYSIDLNLTYNTLEHCIDQLKRKTEDILNHDSGIRLCFIGHSTGGLAIRGLMNFYPEIADRTFAVIMVAVPNRGTALADVHENLLPEILRVHKPIRSLTRAANAALEWSDPKHLVMIGFAGVEGWKSTQGFFNGPNDGVVAVSSVYLAQMEDVVLMPRNHVTIWQAFPLAKAIFYFLNELRLPTNLYRINRMKIEDKFRKIHEENALDDLVRQARANVELGTLGGKFFWATLLEIDGWKLQKNQLTSHVRILNPSNIRKAWGSTHRMHEMMDVVLSQLQASDFISRKKPTHDDPIIARMERLQALYEKGLITEAEYERKRMILLGEL
ncbi:SHOCT domain-containing protein [Ectothiorhodospira haloalkaliphila]|uniref:SHOCT domain-containing protein n=1 Tax=Ectothiorhodospira haloalkaliphila TaxID=421628 RepID=UPI001EE7F4FE|nr:SHOCT domain-containing protein [Ectothiorhodospira haloalkaliphila]MCG5525877.1 SHOCT domain-containing protein [Ectothiorhodospira haloalkaliphila]